MDARTKLALSNAFNLLVKTVGGAEQTFTKEDWQMLQVAQFLVSKEKVLHRDADNKTLHFGTALSFYYIHDLCERIYSLGVYVYNENFLDPNRLVIDTTKEIDYLQEIPEYFKECKHPTFEEALIIFNMVRNSVAHGAYEIDFENSMLRIDNTLYKPDGSGDLQFKIKSDIPLSLISDIDYGNIMRSNSNTLINALFRAMSKEDYFVYDNKVSIILEVDNKRHSVDLSTQVFMLLVNAYEKYMDRFPSVNVDDIDVGAYRNRKFRLVKRRDNFYKRGRKVDEIARKLKIAQLDKIFEVLEKHKSKSLDSRVVTRFLYLVNSDLPHDVRESFIQRFNAILNKVDYQNTTEDTFSSISLALGVSTKKNSVDFIALYNFLTLLFSSCPLKEGNKLLTQFIDTSGLNIDVVNTKDTDITTFYADVREIIKKFEDELQLKDQQYNYQMPCINLYASTLADILKRLRTRNNAYIRHIRNAIEHSGVDLNDDVAILNDVVINGDEVENTFQARAKLDNLVSLSINYSSIYEVDCYAQYCEKASKHADGLAGYKYKSLFQELRKGIDDETLMRFMNKLSLIHEKALGELWDFEQNLAEVTLCLGMTAENLQRSKSTGGKTR